MTVIASIDFSVSKYQMMKVPGIYNKKGPELLPAPDSNYEKIYHLTSLSVPVIIAYHPAFNHQGGFCFC